MCREFTDSSNWKTQRWFTLHRRLDVGAERWHQGCSFFLSPEPGFTCDLRVCAEDRALTDSPIHIQQEREHVIFLSFLIIMWIIMTIMPPYIICQVPKPISDFRAMKWADWLSQGSVFYGWSCKWCLGSQSPVGIPRKLGLKEGESRKDVRGLQAKMHSQETWIWYQGTWSILLLSFNICVPFKEVTLSLSSTGYPCFNSGYLKAVLNLNAPFLLPGQDFPLVFRSPAPLLGFILHAIKRMKKLNSGCDSQVLKSTLKSYFVSPC